MKGNIKKIKGVYPVTLFSAVYEDGTNKTLKTIFNEFSNKFKEYNTCSSLNMIPNSKKDSGTNYKILLESIKKGINIIVDNTYYIKSQYDSFDDNNIINNLNIIGDGKANSGFILLGGNYFNAKGNIIIENLRIDCTLSSMTNFFIYIDTPTNIDIKIKNNYITGDIRVLTTNIPSDHNFDLDHSKINNLKIIGNEFYDVYNSSGSMTIFKCTDTPITNTYIENNYVTNFSYVFFDNSITNDSKNGEYIYENTINTIIKNNIVTNLIDYDPKEKNSSLPTYFCFTILESIRCECVGNTFEGFKIINAPETVVYDNYFSVSELIYENNTWKNIINFTPNVHYTDIMKSKSGSEKFKLNRYYRKNNYIIEKEYADRLSQNRNLLIKRIDTYESFIDNVIIEDNYFDLYILNFNRYKKVKNYIFNKNTIKTYTRDCNEDTQAFIGIVDCPDTIEERKLLFTNNIILCNKEPESGTKISSLITNYSGSNNNLSIIFENNYIEIYELTFLINDERKPNEILNNPLGIDINFNNNNIKIKNNKRNLYFFTKSFSKLRNFNNNSFELDLNNNTFYIFYEPYTVPDELIYELPICINTIINLSNYTSSNMSLRLLPLKGMNKYNYEVYFNIKRLTYNSYENFNIDFKIRNDTISNILDCFGIDNNKNEIEYTHKLYKLDGSSNKVYGNLYLRQDNKQGTQTMNVNVSNSKNDRDIMLSFFTKDDISNPKNDMLSITMNILKI